MNTFSIILPVYNGGEYVKECVQSILSQTHTDFNLLVLDNCSTDGTLQWLQSLNDNRIVIYPTAKNLGIVENWARIKTIAKNQFVTLIGHDDILLPHYLEEMNRLIATHPDASLYQAHFSFVDEKGRFQKFCMPMDERQEGQEFLACQFARTMDSMGTGYMMRSSDFDALGGMPEQYPKLIFADYQLWVELSLLSYKATSARVCFKYRLHDSTSRLTNGSEYQQSFEQYVFFVERLVKKNEKVKAVVEKYGHDFLMYFCESLSHRLLKTPPGKRETDVAGFIDKCIGYAKRWIPDQSFRPLDKTRISLAKKLDASAVSRKAFLLYKKIITKI